MPLAVHQKDHRRSCPAPPPSFLSPSPSSLAPLIDIYSAAPRRVPPSALLLFLATGCSSCPAAWPQHARPPSPDPLCQGRHLSLVPRPPKSRLCHPHGSSASFSTPNDDTPDLTIKWSLYDNRLTFLEIQGGGGGGVVCGGAVAQTDCWRR